MSFTYSTLKSTLQDYTQNDETSFISNLPIFIRLGEERIIKSVQLNVFQKKCFWKYDFIKPIPYSPF